MNIQTETVEETQVAAAPEAPEETVETAADDSSEIVIDGRAFKSEAEALAYAKERMTSADIELARADAYRQAAQDFGRNVTSQPNVTTQAQEDDKEWETKFFENPKAAIEAAMKRAKEEAHREISQMTSLERENARLWGKFCDQNPDLADSKDIVDLITAQHQEAIMALGKTKGEDAALAYVAQKTRAKFTQYMEKAKPGTALPNTKGGASPSGGGSNVTKSDAKKTSDKPLSFIDQVKQNKKRHA